MSTKTITLAGSEVIYVAKTAGITARHNSI